MERVGKAQLKYAPACISKFTTCSSEYFSLSVSILHLIQEDKHLLGALSWHRKEPCVIPLKQLQREHHIWTIYLRSQHFGAQPEYSFASNLSSQSWHVHFLYLGGELLDLDHNKILLSFVWGTVC